MRTAILFAIVVASGACFRDAPQTTASPITAKQPAKPPAPAVIPPAPDPNTGFDLYVLPTGVTSWSLDGEVRSDHLPVRIRGIAPGPHVVTIDAPPGYQAERRTIDVRAGAAPEVDIELAPIDKHAAPATKLRVTGLEPTKGDVDGGTYVKISGDAFTCGGSCLRAAKVYFGSRQGTVIRFASDSELIVEAPAGKAGEVVDVLVIFAPGGELRLPKAFTFVAKP